MLRPVALAVALILILGGCGSSTPSSSGSSTSAGGTTTSAGTTAPGGGTTASDGGTTAPGGGTTTAGGTTAPALSFEGMPLENGPSLALASTTGTAPIDGINCNTSEQLAYHIHAHLLVFDHGFPRALPAGVGIPGSITEQTPSGPVAQGGSCLYWLHTHAPDGVIHIESPTRRVYTLGDFFDEWRQPLSSHQVAGAAGQVIAWVNGHRWAASPLEIPLTPHADIQLDVGTPAPAFVSVSWAGTEL